MTASEKLKVLEAREQIQEDILTYLDDERTTSRELEAVLSYIVVVIDELAARETNGVNGDELCQIIVDNFTNIEG